jgi:ribosomal protein L40E
VGVRLTKTKYDNTPVIKGIKVKMKDEENSEGIFCTGCGELNPMNKQYCKKCEVKLY